MTVGHTRTYMETYPYMVTLMGPHLTVWQLLPYMITVTIYDNVRVTMVAFAYPLPVLHPRLYSRLIKSVDLQYAYVCMYYVVSVSLQIGRPDLQYALHMYVCMYCMSFHYLCSRLIKSVDQTYIVQYALQ